MRITVQYADEAAQPAPIAPVVTASPPRTTVSAVMAARNEGGEVLATVKSLLETGSVHEVIVVDDGSEDGGCKGLPEGVRVIRLERGQGQSTARRIGLDAATGEVLISMDAHMRCTGSVLPFAEAAEDRNCILCATSAPLTDDPGHAESRYSGCHLQVHKTGSRIEAKWNHNRPPRNYCRIGAPMGAFYAIPRNLYRQLGGWIVLPGAWGFEEEALAMAAWFMGIPIRLDTSTVALHLYRKANPTPNAGHAADINGIYATWLLSSGYAWENWWSEKARTAFPAAYKTAMEHAATARAVEERARYHAMRQIDDEAFMRDAVNSTGWWGCECKHNRIAVK